MPVTRRKFLEKTAAAEVAAFFSSLEDLAARAPTNKLRIGIIGCGSVSNWHLPHLLTSPLLQIVSLSDTRPEPVEALVLGNDWEKPAELHQKSADGYQWQEDATKISESLNSTIEPRMNAKRRPHVVKTIEAARKSSKSGKRIRLKSTFTFPML